MNDILNIILQDTYCLSQLKHKLSILKSYLFHIFFGASLNLPSADLTWLKSLSPQISQQFNKDNVYPALTNLENAVKKLPILIIYLAFAADDTALPQIGSFVRKTFNPSMLLDVKFDPNLIAGAALVWKGIYKDYSLRGRIEERKMEIVQSFKKYLR